MPNYVNESNIPLGLGMALAQNVNALNYYASLSKSQQNAIINHTHQINSKKEMQAYVDNLMHSDTIG